jgi:hypothetical protein
MQYLGIGIQGLCSILGTLAIHFSVENWSNWKELESIVGQAEEQVADEVSLENINLVTEKAAEQGEVPDEDRRVPITASIDMGWQKHSSSKTYNSNSGHSFLVGAITFKILGRHVFLSYVGAVL